MMDLLLRDMMKWKSVRDGRIYHTRKDNETQMEQVESWRGTFFSS